MFNKARNGLSESLEQYHDRVGYDWRTARHEWRQYGLLYLGLSPYKDIGASRAWAWVTAKQDGVRIAPGLSVLKKT